MKAIESPFMTQQASASIPYRSSTPVFLTEYLGGNPGSVQNQVEFRLVGNPDPILPLEIQTK